MTIEKLTAGDPDTQSADIVSDHLDRLRELFPEAFTEGRVDFDVLRQLLGDAIEDGDERYGLNWRGKRAARRLALTPSTGTLRPAPEESVDWDTTQNLMIEGDNLEVLKLLRKSYAGKVKAIYIDPPYNTGNDFIYPDDFRSSIRNYREITGQVGDAGDLITSNPEGSGRYHTSWLDMIYPRLMLARDMLRPDGAIFVSIDDHEVANLRLVMDEVFGHGNFVASVIWQKVYAPKNTARHFSEDHDYVLVYARDGEQWLPRPLPRTAAQDELYKNPDSDPRGPWMSDNLTARNFYGQGTYTVVGPTGKEFTPGKGRYWRQSKDRFDEMNADGRIWWGASGNGMPRQKRFLSEVAGGRVPQTLWTYDDVGHTQDAKRELNEFVEFEETANVLNSVKPTQLLQRVLQLATDPHASDIVMDFFAGSGAFGHAVFNQNLVDEGNRRFVLVQLPEPLPISESPSMSTIADMTRSRLRRSGAAAKETPEFDGDVGFRVFKLDSSNIREWDPQPDDLEATLDAAVENLKGDRAGQDILYELLLKRGIELTVPIEARDITGKTVHSIGAGALFACLAERIERADAEPLALGIVAWRDELSPAGDISVVFRDSAFVDDVAKTNLAEILRQHGLADVKSI